MDESDIRVGGVSTGEAKTDAAPSGTVPRVLVSGASGYIAAHIVRLLLAAGWRVRGTVRSLKNKERIDHLKSLYPGSAFPLELVEADLNSDAGWDAACKDCTYVMHTASPFPRDPPKDEQAFLETATGGTLRVLKAAHRAGVKRTVVTSSVASVCYGVDQESKVFDETDWSVTAPKPPHKIEPYMKSKTLAERAAWDFVTKNPGMELATVNPSLVFGPALSSNTGTSTDIVTDILGGKVPALADIYFPLVDVRDVAMLHAICMVDPKANGERFLATVQTYQFKDFVDAAAKKYNPMGYKCPTMVAPNCIIRCFSCCDKNMAAIKDNLGLKLRVSSAKAQTVLGYKFRDGVQAFLDHCESVIAYGSAGLKDLRPAGEKGTNKYVKEPYSKEALARISWKPEDPSGLKAEAGGGGGGGVAASTGEAKP